MSHRAAVAVALFALSGAASAFPPGRAVVVDHRSWPAGLEASLPRGTSFAAAIEEARAGRFDRAHGLLLASEGEILRAAEAGKLGAPRARSLALKARLLAGHAARLVAAEREAGKRPLPDAQFSAAVALHHLYLSSSALRGHSDKTLLDRAARAYGVLLGTDGKDRWPRARIGRAALLAASGARAQAAREYLIVVAGEHTDELFDLEPAYHAAMGNADRAFRCLEALRRVSPDWLEVRAALRVMNDLDALREDPRFPLLLDGDE